MKKKEGEESWLLQTCCWVAAENVSWLTSHGCLHLLCGCPVSLRLAWESMEGGWGRVLRLGKVTRAAWLVATWTLSTEGSWWGSQRDNGPLFLAVEGQSIWYGWPTIPPRNLSSPRPWLALKQLDFKRFTCKYLETGGNPRADYGCK